MNAREFLDEFGPDEAERVAKKAGTTLGYFRQWAYNIRKPHPRLVKKVVRASDGRLTREALRPDIYL